LINREAKIIAMEALPGMRGQQRMNDELDAALFADSGSRHPLDRALPNSSGRLRQPSFPRHRSTREEMTAPARESRR